MKIRHATHRELVREARRGTLTWSSAVCRRLLELIDDPLCRVLVAVEDGRCRAFLGLTMDRDRDADERRARIVELEVDPVHSRRGIGSRLVRFAERIALIEGCRRVDVDPRIEAWGDGRCWPSLGYGSWKEIGTWKPIRTPAAVSRA